MRIAHLTPGTGDFHCGTCSRDRTLLEALEARGHEVVVVPMYLPSFEDGAPAGDVPIQMGAVNLYLQQKAPVCGLLPKSITDLFDSPRLLRWLSKRGGTTEPAFLGEMTLSMLHGAEGKLGRGVKELGKWFAAAEPFDVILLSNALLCGVVPTLAANSDATLVCTLQGEAPFLDALPDSYRSAAWATLRERMARVHGCIAVSRHYADLMIDRLGLADESVGVVLNGMALADIPRAERLDVASRPAIGYLARMCEDKGLPLLVDSYLKLRERGRVPSPRLRIAGVQRAEDRPLVEHLRLKVREAGAAEDVEFLPNLDQDAKREFLRSLAVLSVPAKDDESFGLYLLEAMAAGVPVVQPRHAAFPEILEATGGGILCDPESADSLADGLERLLLDDREARRLAEQGRRSVLETFTAERMAEEVEKCLSTFAAAKARMEG